MELNKSLAIHIYGTGTMSGSSLGVGFRTITLARLSPVILANLL
jgi:hypothetical protein